jgi:hypothetical protein
VNRHPAVHGCGQAPRPSRGRRRLVDAFIALQRGGRNAANPSLAAVSRRPGAGLVMAGFAPGLRAAVRALALAALLGAGAAAPARFDLVVGAGMEFTRVAFFLANSEIWGPSSA